MRIHSVNVSLPKEVTLGGQTRRTAICKEAVQGPVQVHRLHLEGDGQGNLQVHGGVDKAVYAYPLEHYPHWNAEQDASFPMGQFGENLTTEGLLEETVAIGDVYRMGTALLEVSEPREPCSTLAFRMQDLTFPKRFLRSRRVGFYLRVLEPGVLQAGGRHRQGGVRAAGSDHPSPGGPGLLQERGPGDSHRGGRSRRLAHPVAPGDCAAAGQATNRLGISMSGRDQPKTRPPAPPPLRSPQTSADPAAP